jgi:hypothetical protein
MIAAVLVVAGMLVFMWAVIAVAVSAADKAIRWAEGKDKSEAERERKAAIAAHQSH